jgi:FMN phosphatase YigB (HAD superfamily)
VRALVFDFGGTLDTNGVHWSEKFYEAYERAGVYVSKLAFEDAYRAAESRIGDRMLKAEDGLRPTLRLQVSLQFEALTVQGALSAGDLHLARAHRIADGCYDDVRRTICDALPLLREWASRCPLSLVSNFYGNLHCVCRELNIAPLFGAIIDSASVGVRKPDPAIFRLACEALRIPPEDTVVVGDSYTRDIVPAKTLGCRTVWLHGKSWDAQVDTSQADFVIHSVHELQPQLFERAIQ